MKYTLITCLFLIAILNCDITSSEIFVMQKEDILGIWHGEVEVVASKADDTYTKSAITVTIKDRDTTRYSLQDTFDIWIQEKMTSNTWVITHQGYLTNLKEEYEATLQYDFYREHIGSTSKYPIFFTQTASDSIKVQFSTYEFKVRN